MSPKSIFISILLVCSKLFFAQKADTNVIDRLIEHCKYVELYDPDSAIVYANMALQMSGTLKDSVRIAIIYRRLGNAGLIKGDLKSAESFQKKALTLSERIRFKPGVAAALSNIANVKVSQGLNNEALEYYQKALLLFLEVNDKAGYARILGNIGLVCQEMKDHKKALAYQLRSYAIRKELGDTFGLALATGNIGSSYFEMKKYDSCFIYLDEALYFNSKINSKQGLAILYGNYGSFLKDLQKFEKAELMLRKGYEISEELHDVSNKGHIALSLGHIYINKKDYPKALAFADTAISIGGYVGELALRSKGYKVKSEILKAWGKPADALRFFEMHYLLKDSILNDENRSEFAKKELQLQYENEKLQQSMEQEKKDAVASEKLKQQKTIQYFLFAILAGILITSIYIYRNYRQKKAANLALESKNKEIDQQRGLLQTKNSEILDSIHYAKRIQKALLASDALVSKHVPEHFIFYKPKDIVSGDFYWASTVASKFLFATCDCTGHGVPGAFMSLLNISFLNEATSQKGITQPHLIFEEIRKDIIYALNRDDQEQKTKDGMDAVLVSFDLANLRMTLAAANNPVIIVRNGEMIRLDGDKTPVGLSYGELKPFTLKEFQLQKGDCVYTFTDGYSDQFGGPKGKKFKQKNLEQLLTTIYREDMKAQHAVIAGNFESWKGELEQIDDVLVVGIRIS